MSGKEGGIVGLLTQTGELTIMATVGLFGILCDRIGRRPVYALGLFFMGVSYVLMPFATTVVALVLVRVVYSVGTSAATGMLGTVTNDYPQEVSRGKLIAARPGTPTPTKCRRKIRTTIEKIINSGAHLGDGHTFRPIQGAGVHPRCRPIRRPVKAALMAF